MKYAGPIVIAMSVGKGSLSKMTVHQGRRLRGVIWLASLNLVRVLLQLLIIIQYNISFLFYTTSEALAQW